MFHVQNLRVGGGEEEQGGATVGAIGVRGNSYVLSFGEARQDYASPMTGHITDSSHTVLRVLVGGI